METTNAEIVADPVGLISISGVHGRKELDQRLALASDYRERGTPGVGRLVAGALIGAALMFLLDPGRARRRTVVRDDFDHDGHPDA